MGSLRGMNSRGESPSFQGEDAHLLGVEHLGLFDPFCDSGGDQGHGENHSGELLVKPERELLDEGNVEKMKSRLDGTRSGNPLILGRRSGEGRVCSPQKGLWTQGE